MALPLHLELIGKKQGKIDGSCDMAGRENTILVQGFSQGMVLPHNPLDGLTTNSRFHFPVSIVKVVDKSTPSLYQALVTGEQFSQIKLNYYQINETGHEEHYFTQILEDAVIISIDTETPVVFDKKYESFGDMEVVSFSYKTVKWIYEIDGIETEDKNCKTIPPQNKKKEMTFLVDDPISKFEKTIIWWMTYPFIWSVNKFSGLEPPPIYPPFKAPKR